MAKRLVVKTGEYTNQQGEPKGEYTKVGVMLNNNNGDFVLLDPSVNLAGVLIKQNALAVQKGQQPRDSVMVSIFEDQQQSQPQQGGYQQQGQQGGYQQPAMNQQQTNPRAGNNDAPF
jgi:hypothetical protein